MTNALIALCRQCHCLQQMYNTKDRLLHGRFIHVLCYCCNKTIYIYPQCTDDAQTCTDMDNLKGGMLNQALADMLSSVRKIRIQRKRFFE